MATRDATLHELSRLNERRSELYRKWMMNIDRADVVMIGGGVIGLASAYFISRRGWDVVLVEKGIPDWEASGRNGGWALGFSPEHYQEDERMALAREALQIWQTLDEELGAPTEFVLGGNLMVALEEDDMPPPYHEDMLERSRRWGGEARRVDLKEMREILPGVTERAMGGGSYQFQATLIPS